MACGFTKTRSEARRLIEGGGARLNDSPIRDVNLALGPADFAEGRLKLSSGKKKHVVVQIAPGAAEVWVVLKKTPERGFATWDCQIVTKLRPIGCSFSIEPGENGSSQDFQNEPKNDLCNPFYNSDFVVCLKYVILLNGGREPRKSGQPRISGPPS